MQKGGVLAGKGGAKRAQRVIANTWSVYEAQSEFHGGVFKANSVVVF